VGRAALSGAKDLLKAEQTFGVGPSFACTHSEGGPLGGPPVRLSACPPVRPSAYVPGTPMSAQIFHPPSGCFLHTVT
jgi:hypothetical protein